jgi:hypothetical protein
MKITVNELQISNEKVWMLGPTFARCPNPNVPDCGSMIMNVACFDGPDSGVGNLMYRSYDEGESWVEEGFIEKSYMCDREGSMLKVGGNAALYTDEKAGVMLFTSNEMYWSKNKFQSTKQCARQFYRLSFDNGHSWGYKRYIVMPGMNSVNPIPDVVYGRNFALSMASQTRRADDDSLLVALQCQIVDSEGKEVTALNQPGVTIYTKYVAGQTDTTKNGAYWTEIDGKKLVWSLKDGALTIGGAAETRNEK